MASADDPSRARFGAAMLDGFAVDVSHQEIERVVVELEELYRSQPGEWLPIAGIGDYLARELGYEDLDEFEDALKSDFAAFVGKLPHVVISRVESELTPGTFRDVFKVTTPAATGKAAKPRVMRLRARWNRTSPRARWTKTKTKPSARPRSERNARWSWTTRRTNENELL